MADWVCLGLTLAAERLDVLLLLLHAGQLGLLALLLNKCEQICVHGIHQQHNLCLCMHECFFVVVVVECCAANLFEAGLGAQLLVKCRALNHTLVRLHIKGVDLRGESKHMNTDRLAKI
jgi:hypothetical protein